MKNCKWIALVVMFVFVGGIVATSALADDPKIPSRIPKKIPQKVQIDKSKLLMKYKIPKELIEWATGSCESDDDCTGCAKCFNGKCEKPGCLGPTGEGCGDHGWGGIGLTPITATVAVCDNEQCPDGYWILGGGGGGMCCAKWDECSSDSECESNLCTSHVGIGKFCSECYSDAQADEWQCPYLKCHSEKTCVNHKCQ